MNRIGQIKEKRRFPRLNDRILIFSKTAESLEPVRDITKNISSSGLMFEPCRSISPQTIFDLEIYQPLRESKREFISISILAKVKWVTQINIPDKYEGSNKYRIGVEFIEIDDRERKWIAGYVQDKLNA